MNIVLWIIAIVLAVAFLFAGLFKVTSPKQKLYDKGMTYVEDYSDGFIKFTGLVEVLGAVGLIVPAVTGIAPILTPIAATGLVIVMIGAIIVHLRRGEQKQIAPSLILGILAAIVAIGRFWIVPF